MEILSHINLFFDQTVIQNFAILYIGNIWLLVFRQNLMFDKFGFCLNEIRLLFMFFKEGPENIVVSRFQF